MSKIGRRRKSEIELQFNARLGGLTCELRRARGMRAKELAAAVGITQQQLSNYEAGAHAIPVFFLDKLSHYIGVSLPDLVHATSCCVLSEKRCAQCLRSR
jgi:transcriptional regulator with XRE-family HTH domain